MGLVETPREFLQNAEGFHKWFNDVEVKLFEDLVNNYEGDEEEAESSIRKAKVRRAEDLVDLLSEATVMLELEHDIKNGSTFVYEFCHIEAFAVQGTLAFLNAFTNKKDETGKVLQNLHSFLESCGRVKTITQTRISGLRHLYSLLSLSCKMLLNEPMEESLKGGETCSEEVTIGVKAYFLRGLNKSMFCSEVSSLTCQLLAIAPHSWEWSLLHFTQLRTQTYENSKNDHPENVEERREAIENAFNASPTNPRTILGLCQHLCDCLKVTGLTTHLNLLGKECSTPTEIVTYIRNSSETITTNHPTFLEANFTFAKIFASELPITKQDKPYSKQLLQKAVANFSASWAVHHQLGLFLIKGRQFRESKAFFEESARLNPQALQTQYSLVKLLLRDPIEYKDDLEVFFNSGLIKLLEGLGEENELSFWRGCYFFMTGDKDLAITTWIEVILTFYVTRPEVELDLVLPFQKLNQVAKEFMWSNSLILKSVAEEVQDARLRESGKRKVVFHRLRDLVDDAMNNNNEDDKRI